MCPQIIFPKPGKLELILFGQDGGYLYFSDLISSATWRRSWEVFGQKATVELIKLPGIAEFLPLGGMYVLATEQGEVIRGRDLNDQIHAVSLDIYDAARDLMESEDDQQFLGPFSPAVATKKILNDFGIPAGEIADPGEVLSTQIYRGRKFSDMIIDMYVRASLATGQRYAFRFLSGTMNVLPLADTPDPTQEWVFRRGENLLDTSTFTRNALGKVTQIKFRGTTAQDSSMLESLATPGEQRDPEPFYVLAKASDEVRKRYGTVQKMISDSSVKDQDQALQIAQEELERRSLIDCGGTFTSFAVDVLWPGDIIWLQDEDLGIEDHVYVKSIDFQATGDPGVRMMNLEWTVQDPMQDWFDNLLQTDKSTRSALKKRGAGQSILTKIAAQVSQTGYPILPSSNR